MHEGEIIVSGIVFHDANGNQRKDASERGLSNISVISQSPDAQGGAVNASTTTAADGSFTIQTHVGDRVSIVPGAGFKALASSSVIVREGMLALVFPLYVDKVVVERVIRTEPSTVTVPAPQVYVTPLITVPAPVVNVQPANVHMAPAEVIVEPAPVHVSPVIEPMSLWAAIAVICLTVLTGAGLMCVAIRAHTRTLRDVAIFQARFSTYQSEVNATNWRGIAEQVIADTTGRVVTVEALVWMSVQPVPTMCFRATNSQVFIFRLTKKGNVPQPRLLLARNTMRAKHFAAVQAIHAQWRFFAMLMHVPCHLPGLREWRVAIVSDISIDHQHTSFEQVDFSHDHQPRSLDRKMCIEHLPAGTLRATFPVNAVNSDNDVCT